MYSLHLPVDSRIHLFRVLVVVREIVPQSNRHTAKCLLMLNLNLPLFSDWFHWVNVILIEGAAMFKLDVAHSFSQALCHWTMNNLSKAFEVNAVSSLHETNLSSVCEVNAWGENEKTFFWKGLGYGFYSQSYVGVNTRWARVNTLSYLPRLDQTGLEKLGIENR